MSSPLAAIFIDFISANTRFGSRVTPDKADALPNEMPGQTGYQLRPPDISKNRLFLILLLSCSERALPSPHSGDDKKKERKGQTSRSQATVKTI
ncbi:Uncharacterised protein [Salmonella enterica subsp. enterica serovar Typhi]|nr:Uncharacterised protein [Salmonella enterica subsp. enterica serovar Typhi]CGX65363.1 Uncharacterised protein [Salmonella enterica subsp. enterica serovar Typhi]CHK19354.1 Uncharacterised protein [Salmonella enterica subsp. enterica serovar Typhi]CHK52518.1 Uncharacterised protein [Salmonella enterica subsp. enterica serovar Typhi]CQS48020.1 Uncharacterised protein [Salmonella enterica subsp. enterica serovar Typhi]